MQFRHSAHQYLCHLCTASAPTRCAPCPRFHLPSGLLCSGHLSTSRAAAHCKSPICSPSVHLWAPILCTPQHVSSSTARCCQSPAKQDRAPGLRNQMLCPRQTVQHSPRPDKGTVFNPNEKMLQYTPITKYTHYIVGVGPLKQQLERGPHYSTNNVQTSVAYNNPNQHCGPRTPATRCAGLSKGTHITIARVHCPMHAMSLAHYVHLFKVETMRVNESVCASSIGCTRACNNIPSHLNK